MGRGSLEASKEVGTMELGYIYEIPLYCQYSSKSDRLTTGCTRPKHQTTSQTDSRERRHTLWSWTTSLFHSASQHILIIDV